MVSIVDNRLVLHRNTLGTRAAACLPHCEYPNHCCHTDYQLHKSLTLKLDTHSIPLFKLWSILQVHSWYSDLSLRLWVFDVTECLDNFVCFSLSSRTSPFRKRSVSFFSVGLPRAVCAFVSLRRNNILQQYIDTFLETASPNFIQTASSCRFEKFRIKRNPNRPSLDYPLDLTK